MKALKCHGAETPLTAGADGEKQWKGDFTQMRPSKQAGARDAAVHWAHRGLCVLAQRKEVAPQASQDTWWVAVGPRGTAQQRPWLFQLAGGHQQCIQDTECLVKISSYM